jgi:hypothetical protein
VAADVIKFRCATARTAWAVWNGRRYEQHVIGGTGIGGMVGRKYGEYGAFVRSIMKLDQKQKKSIHGAISRAASECGAGAKGKSMQSPSQTHQIKWDDSHITLKRFLLF